MGERESVPEERGRKMAIQGSSFMTYVNSNLAREAGRLADWREKFWSRRYEAILVTEEERSQIERLKYLLSQGCKEGLVARPQDWPGVHAVRALLGEEELEGLWFDRTQEYAARHRGQAFERLQYATLERLELAPLPAWRNLRPEIYRQRVAELVAEIVAEVAADREASGAPLRPLVVQAQNPHDRPAKMKKSPAPFCHAASLWALTTKSAARRLLRVLQGVPGYRGTVEAGRSRCLLSDREPSAGVAVRGQVGRQRIKSGRG